MIPESYENEHSILLIFTFFKVFLFWLTFRRPTLECCHSAGIPSLGSLFWCDFRNLRNLYMWNNMKIYCRWFRKVMKINIAFCWLSPFSKFFFFDRRFADWPWNVVILLAFQVRVHSFGVIFGICDTCRCEITQKLLADDSGNS